MLCPEQLNCAADAPSRFNCNVAAHMNHASPFGLPMGLVLNGDPSTGGGESLLYSLFKCSTHICIDRLLANEEELKTQLVGQLLSHPARYGLRMDRDSRKTFRLMLHLGQLPCLVVLLAASKLYKFNVQCTSGRRIQSFISQMRIS